MGTNCWFGRTRRLVYCPGVSQSHILRWAAAQYQSLDKAYQGSQAASSGRMKVGLGSGEHLMEQETNWHEPLDRGFAPNSCPNLWVGFQNKMRSLPPSPVVVCRWQGGKEAVLIRSKGMPCKINASTTPSKKSSQFKERERWISA